MVVRIDGTRSHSIVDDGLRVLENLAHRGAENADGCTGDGSGITIQIPHEFIVKCGISVPEAGRYGTGLIFLPKDAGRSEGHPCWMFRLFSRSPTVRRSSPRDSRIWSEAALIRP